MGCVLHNRSCARLAAILSELMFQNLYHQDMQTSGFSVYLLLLFRLSRKLLNHNAADFYEQKILRSRCIAFYR